MALINKLQAIGDAIRSKTGGSSNLTLTEMATAISNIQTGASEIDTIPVINNLSYSFNGPLWTSSFLSVVLNKINSIHINNTEGLTDIFRNNNNLLSVNNFPTIYIEIDGVKLSSTFASCGLDHLPTIDWQNHKIGTGASIFNYCRAVEISNNVFLNADFSDLHNFTNGTLSSSYSNMNEVRTISSYVLKNYYHSPKSYSGTIYNQGFRNDYKLNEIRELPVINQKTYTSNMFSSTFDNCGMLKNITFTMNNGVPYEANWSNQTIDLSNNVGFIYQRYYTAPYTNYSDDPNISIVSVASGYETHKNTDDWVHFTTISDEKGKYSKYNHDSAVTTINSLPDVSQGSNNIIKFFGNAGSATDEGAINTLTAEEIAIATAKGWTVTLV